MKKIILLIFYTLTVTLIYTESIRKYDSLLVAIIKIGNGDGELGYRPDLGAGIPKRPVTLTISDNNLIYVGDHINFRLNTYDMNLKYVKTIKEEENTSFSIAYKLDLDDIGNLLYLEDYNGLEKIDTDGNKLFQFKPKQLPYEVRYKYEYFNLDNYTLFYDATATEKINLIDNNGKIYKGDEAFKFYEINQKKQLLSGAIKQNYLVANDLIIKFYREKKIIIHEGKILSGDYNVHREYFKFIKENLNKNNIKDQIEVGNISYSRLIGFDKDNNSYWNCNPQYINAVIVLSQYGEILDAFDISQFYQYIMAVAPNGDVYFMYTNDNGHYFYKISGKWNLNETQITKPTIPRVTSLTASSFVDYKNLYHPLKAFDGDIKTTWLEAATGSGIGESITLELDSEITVDSIQVLPGLFDAKWWKSNNRVKALTMKIGENTTTLQFQDEMKPHKADFKEPKTFKKVEFIIKEVYLSGKDDDTAITEIQFYYKGENIKLDFSKQEAELNKSK